MGGDTKLITLKNLHLLEGDNGDHAINKTLTGYLQSESDSTANVCTSGKHGFILIGQLINGLPGYLCECGVAFVSKELAVRHFHLGRMERQVDHDLSVLNNAISQSNESNLNEDGNEIQEEPDMSIGQGEATPTTERTKKSPTNIQTSKIKRQVTLRDNKKKNKHYSKIKPKVSTELVRRGKKRHIVKKRHLVLEAIYVKYGYPPSITYRRLLAIRLGMTVANNFKTLRVICEETNTTKKVHPVIAEEADEIHFAILQDIEKDPYVDIRTSVDTALTDERIVMVHAILRLSGLKVTKPFLITCACKLGLLSVNVYQAWAVAVEIFLTNAECMYEKYLTEKVMEDAKILYDDIVKSVMCKNWEEDHLLDLKMWKKNISYTRPRLIVEALFVMYGINLHWSYLEACSAKIDIHRNTMFKSWKNAVMRIMFEKGENPYLKFITKEIQEEAVKIHNRIPSSLKDEYGNPRTTNSVEVMRLADNHAAYPGESVFWTKVMEEIYRSFGFQQSFLHLKAFARLLHVSESYVHRHWYETKMQGLPEVNADAHHQEIQDEAMKIKEQADVEVEKLLGYQSKSHDEKKEAMLTAELVMMEIFSKYGEIKDEMYLECCATLLDLTSSDLSACIEKVTSSLNQDAGNVLRMEIPYVQNKAYEMHEKIMLCLQNSFMKTMVLSTQSESS